jgi:hypothetical protein
MKGGKLNIKLIFTNHYV